MASQNDMKEKLILARGLLSDVRYGVWVEEFRCSECNSKRYDNFNIHQMRESCQGAISRIDKAIDWLEKEGDNEPQTTRSSRSHKN